MNRNCKIFDRYGNEIDGDIVPDGGYVRTGLTLMDAAPKALSIADAQRQRDASYRESVATLQRGYVGGAA